MSTGVKLVLGCLAVALVCVLAACGGVLYLGWWGWSQIDALGQEFVAKGYRREMGQVITVPGPVNEPTVYTAQVVRVTGEVNADVAFLVQVAEISGQVNGDIDFSGQVLHIQKGAVVKGDIRVKAAQAVVVEGRVEGQITGNYSVLQDRRMENAPTPQEDTAEASQAEPSSP